MSPHRRARPRLFVLLVALCAVPIISIFAALPWLDQQPDEVVFLFTGIAATVTLAGGLALTILHESQLDEVNRSNLRFSAHWGWGIGTTLIALLLNLPPIHDLIVHWAGVWGGVPNPDRRLVLVSFTVGFMTIVVTQTVCMAVLSTGWALWKSRPAREAA